jgi:limonene-1,2-epoxide hydrolase
MAFDIKAALTSLAPTLATMLGGPFAGTAVSALESALGLSPGSGPDAITKVMQSGSMTPETVAAVRAADQKHAEIIAQQGIDLQKFNLDFEAAQTKAVIEDRVDARKSNAGRKEVWYIAVVILGTFAAMMAFVLYGCWMILQGGISIKDVSVVAAVSGLVGSVVGYVAANAQTVVNFIYGGSLGSEKKTDALAASVQQAISVAK